MIFFFFPDEICFINGDTNATKTQQKFKVEFNQLQLFRKVEREVNTYCSGKKGE